MCKCLICNHNTMIIHDDKNNYNYYKCLNCEFICRDRKTVISDIEEHKTYNYHNNSYEDERYINYFKRFIDSSITPFVNRNYGLDFGSGPSPVLAMLLNRQYGYHMDIYDKYYSKDEVYINKSYDLITCTEVAEHFDCPLVYFELFDKLINQDGIISIMTLFHPNSDDEFLEWFYIRDKTHISFYNIKTFEVIADMLNLEIIYTDNYRYITLKRR